jgi:hypothetical protein
MTMHRSAPKHMRAPRKLTFHIPGIPEQVRRHFEDASHQMGTLHRRQTGARGLGRALPGPRPGEESSDTLSQSLLAPTTGGGARSLHLATLHPKSLGGASKQVCHPDAPATFAGASSTKFAHNSKMSSRKVEDINRTHAQKGAQSPAENALTPLSAPPRGHVALFCRNRSPITFALRGLMSPFGKSSANLAITSSASSSMVSTVRSWTGSE